MSIDAKSVIVIIPARGGSKGIPRKNVRILANKPLIRYSIDNCLKSKYIDRVVVSTDDDEIAYIASHFGSEVLRRPSELSQDEIPLDPVIHHAVVEFEKETSTKYDIVITVQPTSPLLSTDILNKAIERFIETDADTLISVVDDRHLSWTRLGDKYEPNYTERVNRQYLPPRYKETGGFVITRREFVTEKSRFGSKFEVQELPRNQAIDIDDEMDWWVTEKLLKRKKILIRVEGYKEIGLGHVYRTILLANRLIDHELLFVLHEKSDLGIKLISSNNYKVICYRDFQELDNIINIYTPDIVINDILDTTDTYMKYLQEKNLFVVNFEDMGSGSQRANLVINALYTEMYPLNNHYWGKDYYCLREEFFLLNEKKINSFVSNILISFGGTDSNDYTRRIIKIIQELDISNIKITVVVGLGYENINALRAEVLKTDNNQVEILQNIKHISKYMYEADIAITSAGRTVYELASIGTPTIVLAQNSRELRHTFACADNGIVNLGLGYEATDDEISEALLRLINDHNLRAKCNQLMLNNNLKSGIHRVLNLIFKGYEDFFGGKIM